MSQRAFDITAADFWTTGGGEHVYTEGRWQGDFLPDTVLTPDRGAYDPYTYSYGEGNSFWEDYAAKPIVKIRLLGTNYVNMFDWHADLNVALYGPLGSSYTYTTSPSSAEFVFNSTVLLSSLTGIWMRDKGTDYGGNNGYNLIEITLDGVGPDIQMFWMDHQNVYEEPYHG